MFRVVGSRITTGVLLLLPGISFGTDEAMAQGRPNLVPTPISGPSTAAVGQSIQFDAGVRNAGGADSDVFNVKWLVDGAEVGAYGSHSSVPSGGTVLDGNSQFSYSFPSPGLHVVEFVVDADDHIAELGEGDNVLDIQVTVHVCAGERCGNPRSNESGYIEAPRWVLDILTSRRTSECVGDSLTLGVRDTWIDWVDLVSSGFDPQVALQKLAEEGGEQLVHEMLRELGRFGGPTGVVVTECLMDGEVGQHGPPN